MSQSAVSVSHVSDRFVEILQNFHIIIFKIIQFIDYQAPGCGYLQLTIVPKLSMIKFSGMSQAVEHVTVISIWLNYTCCYPAARYKNTARQDSLQILSSFSLRT